jgi:hypothetical protein
VIPTPHSRLMRYPRPRPTTCAQALSSRGFCLRFSTYTTTAQCVFAGSRSRTQARKLRLRKSSTYMVLFSYVSNLRRRAAFLRRWLASMARACAPFRSAGCTMRYPVTGELIRWHLRIFVPVQQLSTAFRIPNFIRDMPAMNVVRSRRQGEAA